MSKIHNFSAGPCILPQEVLKEASEAVKSWENHGLSLIEMSHRSKPFVEVMDEVRSLTKELLNLHDRFEILYLQGGASLGFLTTAYNLIPEGGQRHMLTRVLGLTRPSKKLATLAKSKLLLLPRILATHLFPI